MYTKYAKLGFQRFHASKTSIPTFSKTHIYTYSYAICHYWPLYQYVGLRTCNYINDNETFFKFISEKFSKTQVVFGISNKSAGLRF